MVSRRTEAKVLLEVKKIKKIQFLLEYLSFPLLLQKSANKLQENASLGKTVFNRLTKKCLRYPFMY